MDASVWPLFGLRIVTPRLELRYPDDDDLITLAEVAANGIHDPTTMPFSYPWTDASPPELQRRALQWHWRTRAQWSVDVWELGFATVVDGEVVGTQGIRGEKFPVMREAMTGSWLGRAHQGKGIGTEMRAAVLHFLFEGLGAEYALSGAWHDNEASLAVSRHHGYAEAGRARHLRREQPDWLVSLRLDRATWTRQRRDDITLHGLDACKDMFGLA